jgi:hypothetical protein
VSCFLGWSFLIFFNKKEHFSIFLFVDLFLWSAVVSVSIWFFNKRFWTAWALTKDPSHQGRRPNQTISLFSSRSCFPASQLIGLILAFNQSREIDDISTNKSDSNYKFIDIIKPSERLSSLLQNAATETHSRATSLEIYIIIISLRPSFINIEMILTEFPNIETILKKFSDINSKIKLKRPILQKELTDSV